jgi:hypothetical protein
MKADQHRQAIEPGLSLLFARGTRPNAFEIAALGQNSAPSGDSFLVSHRPADMNSSLELLTAGLTFTLAGLRPGRGERAPVRRHAFGLDGPELPIDLETARLMPGAHVWSGASLLPVVRATLSIAATLARLPGVRAVCWHPAASCMETALFVRTIGTWLAGGPFPVLGLMGLLHEADGAIRSEGLAFFIGQELWLGAAPEEAPAETIRLAVHLIQRLIEAGPSRCADELTAPDGSRLDVDPSQDGRVLRVWRRAERRQVSAVVPPIRPWHRRIDARAAPLALRRSPRLQ